MLLKYTRPLIKGFYYVIFSFFCVGGGVFELRASGLLGRCSTT
jgi:hypothetical protein